jgi:hypothetical protein
MHENQGGAPVSSVGGREETRHAKESRINPTGARRMMKCIRAVFSLAGRSMVDCV